jgi:hypothetical protein
MDMNMRGGILRVGHTFSAITNVISFLSREHSHAVCFEILVELPWIGMEAPHSTENNVSSSRRSLGTVVRDAATHFANWASRFGPIFWPNCEGMHGQVSEI